MNIYIPFTYIIGWSQHKKFYYGAKYAQGCQPSDLWTTYFTSSNYVKEFREQFGEPDIIKVHRTFQSSQDCVSFEHEFLTKIDAKKHPAFLNESNGRGKDFSCYGKVIVKDKNNKIFQTDTNDPRYLSGELVGVAKGLITVKDSNGNFYQVEKDNPRVLSGELTPHLFGKVMVKNKENEKFLVEFNDPRYLSGELVGVAKGLVTVKDSNGKTFKTDINDPRYLSGELLHSNKGTIAAKDKEGNFFRVCRDDSRYLSGELVGVSKGIKFPKIKCEECGKEISKNQIKKHFEKYHKIYQ